MGATLSKGQRKRGTTTRAKLSDDFVRRLEEDFRRHGMEAIEQLRAQNLPVYAQTILKLVTLHEALAHRDEVPPEFADMGLAELRDYVIAQAQEVWGVRLIEGALAITDGKAQT
jgi:hypothetical protein